MGKSEKELRAIIKNRKRAVHDNEKMFEQSITAFNNLLKNGLAKPRGYNLESIEERGTRTMAFNAMHVNDKP